MRHVLLAEDDIDDQTIFKEALHSILPDTLLTIARDGQEAFQILQDTLIRPDAIFSDINMPLLDGLAFGQLVKDNEEFKSIPIFFLSTGVPSKEAVKYDCLMYQKPTTMTSLANIILGALATV